MPTPTFRPLLLVSAFVFVAGCGGSGGGGSAPPPPQTFPVGGTVTGLEAEGLVLQNNGGPDLTISSNGPFTFPNQVASGATYSVTVKTQPSIGPAQLCTVTNGSGTMPNGAVTNVTVTCVKRVSKFLYTVSAAADEVRGFSIDATSGALTALPGQPVQPGIDPLLPVPHPNGRFLYVATRGDQSVPPRVAVYAADNATGALTEIQGSPYHLSTPPPQPGALTVLPPFIHPSGAFGYVSVLYSSSLLHGATIDATTGQLMQIPNTPIDIGAGVGVMLYDSTGVLSIVAANDNNGVGEIRTFLVNTPSGVLTPVGAYPTGGGPAAAFFSPDENYLLATNFFSGTLIVFAVDKTARTLTPVTAPIPTGPAGSQPLGLVFNPRNDVFYVTHVTTTLTPNAPTSVAAFELDAATGDVTPVGTPVSANGADAFAFLHPSGRFLFQYNESAGGIQRFTLDPATGAPTPAADITAIAGAPERIGMILDVSGSFVYVTNPADSTVSSYSVDATTGALTLVDSEPTSAGAYAASPFLLQ